MIVCNALLYKPDGYMHYNLIGVGKYSSSLATQMGHE